MTLSAAPDQAVQQSQMEATFSLAMSQLQVGNYTEVSLSPGA
jgi:hypothetical protein